MIRIQADKYSSPRVPNLQGMGNEGCEDGKAHTFEFSPRICEFFEWISVAGCAVRQVSVCFVGQRGAVYNRHTWGRAKLKHFIRKRYSLLPVSKSVFQFHPAGLPDPHAGQVAAG